jgi:phosphomannomutase/phosphoglucomutase
MALRRKIQPAAETPTVAASRGRGLLVYLLPTFLVALLLVGVLAVIAQLTARSAFDDAAAQSARTTADALARQIGSDVERRRDLLALALADGRVAEALSSGESVRIDEVTRRLQSWLPGTLQVRLLPADLVEPQVGGAAPMGYAGLDMLRKTVETRRPSVAEVHQINSGAPYLAMAQPVAHEGRVIGVLFVAWDLRPLVGIVAEVPGFSGGLELVQGGANGYVVAQAGRVAASGGATIDVPSTIWQVRFVGAGGAGSARVLPVLAVAGGGLLLLVFALLLQWRVLSRDLRGDMGTIVSLGEAIARRESVGEQSVRVASCADAIALLTQGARDAFTSSPTGVRAAGRVAVPAPEMVGQSSQGVEVEEIDSDPAEPLGAAGAAAAAAARPTVDIDASLFRAYDVRGIVGQTLTPAVARLLGQAFATLVQEQGGRQVAVAHDARISSPELAQSLIEGLTDAGCNVLDIGLVPTPLLYFAMQTQPVQGGIMVTGSHNPTDYNGFKIALGDRVLDGDELQQLRERMRQGAFNQGSGQVQRIDLLGDYIEAVNREIQLARPLKVVIDGGNGAAGEVAIGVLESLGCEVVPLFCEADGTFPNHHPDPSQPDNLSSLMLEVQAQDADLGVAFDGDGDRLGIIDNAGNLIWPDRILMMLASDILERHPGVDILYDVKSSRHLASFVLSHGGRPIMWQTGHSRMRAKMLETGALLGGEFTGHLFIKERWYGFDDAIYATARVLEILALDSRTTAALFAEIPDSPGTPELQLPLEEGQAEEVMRSLQAHKVFDDARLIEIDGLRVEFANGWGLVRPSNTTPSLTFRFEAEDSAALEVIKTRFRELMKRAAPELSLPF